MIYGLGPRALRVLTALRGRIARGDWTPGTKLPSHRDLAAEYSVAPLTMRQVLARLEDVGLVSRRSGRGTFVREAGGPAVLIVAGEPTLAMFLVDYLGRAGYRALTARGFDGAVAAEQAIALVLYDLAAPTVHDGLAGLRALRARHPRLPIAAIVADTDELRPLFGTAEWLLHVLPKPIHLGLLDELLGLVRPRSMATD
jgi:CheY-like chemotaxis protein